jgi:hypothetical protein
MLGEYTEPGGVPLMVIGAIGAGVSCCPHRFAMDHRGAIHVSILIRCLALTCLLVSLAACNTAPKNQGTTGRRMDPSSDSSSELGSTGLRSADLVTATDRMAMDIAQRLDVASGQSPPKIFVGKIENKTTGRHQNYQVFLARLRSQLASSGTRSGLEFIREREFVETQRQREYGDKDPASTAQSYQSRADYVLTCEVYDLPSGGTNYYFLEYQLVQLRDASSGPDVGAGTVVWDGSYEVKFQ